MGKERFVSNSSPVLKFQAFGNISAYRTDVPGCAQREIVPRTGAWGKNILCSR